MFINLLAVLTDTLVTAVCVATFQTSTNFVIVGTLVKIIARLLVVWQSEAVGTRASVAAVGVVTRVAALMTSMFAFVYVLTSLWFFCEAAGAWTFLITADDNTISRTTMFMIVGRAFNNWLMFFHFIVFVISLRFHLICLRSDGVFFACFIIVL